MAKALSEEKANAIKQAVIVARESEALEELHRLGFRVTFHEMGRYVEADDLLRMPAGYVSGNCYAVMYARDGQRKHVSGTSAVEALQAAQAWWRWQQGLKDDAAAKFIPSVDHEFVPEALVQQRVSGDTATTKQRRENTERRVISFASGAAEVVDSDGDSIKGDINQASQYALNEEQTSR